MILHEMKTPPVQYALRQLHRRCPEMEKSLSLIKNSRLSPQDYRLSWDGKSARIEAADDAGFLYALSDLPDYLEESGGKPFVHEALCRFEKRGIKLNIPLDARTPSYSDASESAFATIPQIWEFSFWEAYLDEMAAHKMNTLTLWSLSPFPSMVLVPEYPEASLDDVCVSAVPARPDMAGKYMFTKDMVSGLYAVKHMTILEKERHWRAVMDLAAERCIEVYLFTWNLFVFGTEGSGYGITDDQDNPVTRDYIYCAVRALFETYPRLAGIGVTAGENMRREESDLDFLKETYGRAVEDFRKEHPERHVSFIHRSHYSAFEHMASLYRGDPDFYVSFKYAQAHLFSSPRPTFYRDFVKAHPEPFPYLMTLRDDDYYLTRWRDPDFVRELLAGLKESGARGYYFGADGFTWGREVTARVPVPGQELFLQKIWEKLDLIGQLSYDGTCPDSLLERRAARHLGISPGEMKTLAKAWRSASEIIPRVNRTHWHDYDFQWYPESCCMFLHPPVAKLVFGDIREFMACPAMPGAGHLSVSDYVSAGEDLPDGYVTPVQNAAAIRACAEEAIIFSGSYIDGLSRGDAVCADSAAGTVKSTAGVATDTMQSSAGAAADTMQSAACAAAETTQSAVGAAADMMQNTAYAAVLKDLRVMGELGLYYADKLEAAVHLARYIRMRRERGRASFSGTDKEDGSGRMHPETPEMKAEADLAEALLVRAAGEWKQYSVDAMDIYYPQHLSRLCSYVDLRMFDRCADLDVELARSERI